MKSLIFLERRSFALADLVSVMTDSLFPYIMGIFSTAFSTITDNPVLYLPVLVSLASVVIFYVISLIRKFGVKGFGGGRRRRR